MFAQFLLVLAILPQSTEDPRLVEETFPDHSLSNGGQGVEGPLPPQAVSPPCL